MKDNQIIYKALQGEFLSAAEVISLFEKLGIVDLMSFGM